MSQILTNLDYDYEVEVDNPVETARYTTHGEQDYINKIRELVPGLSFYDIGACLGLHTLSTMKLASKVISVEPDSLNFGTLVKNVERNKGTNVECIRAAIKHTTGRTVLYTDKVRSDSPTTMWTSDRTPVTVTAYTFSFLVFKCDLHPDVVKIDVEGDEWEIIDDVIFRRPKYICIEIHPEMLLKRLKNIGDIILPLEKRYSLLEEYDHGVQTNQIWTRK